MIEAMKKLHALGIVAWKRRCKEATGKDGRYELRQETNAYAVLPPSQWKGFADETPPAPPPAPDTIGATPPLPEVAEQNAAAVKTGADIRAKLALAELDPTDSFNAVLIRLYRRQLYQVFLIQTHAGDSQTGVNLIQHGKHQEVLPWASPCGFARTSAPRACVI